MPLLYNWLQQTVRERGSGSGTALVYRDTYLSWRGLAHRVDRRAQELSSFGVGPGAWVGLMLGNVPDFVVLALALSKLGAITVPLDPTTGTRDLDMMLDAAPLRALVTRPRGADSVPPGTVAPIVTTARGTGKPYQPRFVPESRRRLQGTLLNCNLYKRDPRAFADGFQASVVLFTADAGGDPKGVVRSERELEAIASAVVSTLGVKESDRILAIAPLHSGYGLDFGLLTALCTGATLFLDDEVDARRLAKGLREQEITLFPGTPAFYGALARVHAVKPLDPRGARFLSSGSPLPPPVAAAFRDKYQVEILSCYHTTETGPVSVDLAGGAPTSVGRPFAGVELRVASADGAPLPAGAPGPLWLRTAATSNVFIPDLTVQPKAAAAPIGRAGRDGWFRTGDTGVLGPDGALTLVGREDDMVKVDGKRVALGEVEGCLEGHAKVKEAQARIVLDEVGGAAIVARVVSAGDCRADELIDHCARHLAPYKVPRAIEIA